MGGWSYQESKVWCFFHLIKCSSILSSFFFLKSQIFWWKRASSMVTDWKQLFLFLCLIEGMAMKPGEVLCCMLLLLLTWQNTKGCYVCSYNWPIEALWLCNSCIVNEHKTKDVQGQLEWNAAVVMTRHDKRRSFCGELFFTMKTPFWIFSVQYELTLLLVPAERKVTRFWKELRDILVAVVAVVCFSSLSSLRTVFISYDAVKSI